eukprot:GHVP01026340.1.p1 GENE.GHVP01026340.1~~GHVP01026340.1.p1  ORF type:complete len:543 (+),score=58.65 GHVP01026340.1:350-1978(+)
MLEKILTVFYRKSSFRITIWAIMLGCISCMLYLADKYPKYTKDISIIACAYIILSVIFYLLIILLCFSKKASRSRITQILNEIGEVVPVLILLGLISLSLSVKEINILHLGKDKETSKHTQKILFVAMFFLILSSIKRSFLNTLAISFNYQNHCDKIDLALSYYDALNTLGKVRKNAKRLKKNIQNRKVEPEQARVIEDDSLLMSKYKRFSTIAAETIMEFDGGLETSLKWDARSVGQSLYKYLKTNDSGVRLEDLKSHLGDNVDSERFIKFIRTHTKAEEIVLTEKMLVKIIERIFQERLSLSKSMFNIRSALGKISSILDCLIILISILLLTSLFDNINWIGDLLGVLMSVSGFMFSTTAKNMFDSIIFLLFIHPYDVGDRVIINIGSCEDENNLIVDKLSLLSTIFIRWDGVRIYVPNHVLTQKHIVNLRRSMNLIYMYKLEVSRKTTHEEIGKLRNDIGSFIAEKREFSGLFRVNIDSIEKCNHFVLKIYVQCTDNGQDYFNALKVRNMFLFNLSAAIKKLELTYEEPILPLVWADQR